MRLLYLRCMIRRSAVINRASSVIYFYAYSPLYVSQSKTCRLVSMLSVEGSPSRILKVLLMSLGITTRPRSSILLTIPVAFIYLNLLFNTNIHRRGHSRMTRGRFVNRPYNLNRDVSICKYRRFILHIFTF